MPRKKRHHRSDRHVSARGVQKEQPDLRRLARAIIALAQAQAEADAEAQARRRTQQPPSGDAA